MIKKEKCTNCKKELDGFYNLYCEECEEPLCVDCAIHDGFCYYCKKCNNKLKNKDIYLYELVKQ